MDWINITTESQLEEITTLSFSSSIKGILIFKHSTRCSISSMALNRLERGWKESVESIPVYLLDLIALRAISQKIAQLYNVPHESPQILLLKNGKCIYTASHSEIDVSEILAAI
ncbi:MAG: bacillithiol system redox-active protein YtxJ [Bacteroidia bacterium]